jgi:hypothetical protein
VKTLRYKVTVPDVPDMSKTEIRNYIRIAVELWAQGGCPDDPMFGAFVDKVKVSRIMPVQKKKLKWSDIEDEGGI